MSKPKTYTTPEAAKKLRIAVSTFRERIKSANLKAAKTRKTGKRGRPAALWTLADLAGL